MPMTITTATPGPGEKLCGWCNGKGVWSKYDHGWSSPVYSAELGAQRECFVCDGTGLVQDDAPG
jgi:hypothetical protein